MVNIQRFDENPLITPADVQPSLPDLEVLCAFNPAAFKVDDEYRLLLRVAERPVQEKGWVSVPVLAPEEPSGLRIERFREDDPELIKDDPRIFMYRGQEYLTSFSHFRMARSRDGVHFEVDSKPTVMPREVYESFGIEDARVTYLEGQWLITYCAVSGHMSTSPSLMVTKDWETFERVGIIFPPSNKDVVIFPEKIGGNYVARHRPIVPWLGLPSMWTAYSPDLVFWGRHEFLIGPQRGKWDEERVGGGAPPIRTDRGWLEFYHGSDNKLNYRVAALLTDLDDPNKVLVRSEPILEPQADYELQGFLGRVVFHNGLIVEDDGTVKLYYGAADSVTCGCTFKLDEMLDSLKMS